MTNWAPVQIRMVDDPLPAKRDRVNAFEFFGGSNDLELPDLQPVRYVPERLAPWHHRAEYPGAAVHFFLDDYRFEYAWNDPIASVPRLRDAEAVLTPDFSVYREMPLPLLIWQTYRNRWLGAFWQSRGLTVIPTVGWSDLSPFYLWGIPRRSVVAVSTIGIRDDEDALDIFQAGYAEMCRVLEPTMVLVYGTLDGLVEFPVPTREYEPFHARFEARRAS